MKKILLFMLLLVNLQLTTDDGSLSIGFGEVAAQSYWEEELPEVVVTGNAYEECNLCHHTYPKNEMEQHQEYECPERSLTCEKCNISYKYSEPHTCDAKEGNCAFCGKPVDQCTCNGPIITGGGNTGGFSGGGFPGGGFSGGGFSGSGGGGGSGGGSVGDTTTTEPNKNSEETKSKEDSDSINSQAKSVLESLKTYTDKIKQIVENLYSSNRFKFHDETRTYYNPDDKCLYIGNSPTEDKILHEIVHSIQDDLGKLSYKDNSSNNEFETAWVTRTVYFLKNMSWGTFDATDISNSNMTSLGITQDISDSLGLDLYELVDWNENGIVVSDALYTKLKSFLTKENLENFKAYWKKLNVGDEYWHSTDDNYEYILKTYLNKLGY